MTVTTRARAERAERTPTWRDSFRGSVPGATRAARAGRAALAAVFCVALARLVEEMRLLT